MASVLYQTIETLSRDKGIEADIVVGAVEDAIALATRKYYRTQENMRGEMDRETAFGRLERMTAVRSGCATTAYRAASPGRSPKS